MSLVGLIEIAIAPNPKPAIYRSYVYENVSPDVDCKLIFTSHSNFRSLEFVDRGSETQLQVTENSN